MEDFQGYKITAQGWMAIIKIASYALDIPAPSDDVLKKMSYTEKVLMAKRLHKQIDLEDPEQNRRGIYMTEMLLLKGKKR
jgi:hypothetical protein